jgi:hypothetical protein
MTTARQEAKYQYLKLAKSGRTMREINAIHKAGAVGLTDEYAPASGKKNIESLYAFIQRVRSTRIGWRDLTAKKMLRPIRSYPANREEALSAFIVGSKTPMVDWNRDGNLIRKGRPNKSRSGSSLGKIGTRISGDEALIKDLTKMFMAIQKLGKAGKRSAMKNVQKAAKSIRTSASIDI